MEIDFDIYENLPEDDTNFEEEAAKLGDKVHQLETYISTLECDIEKLSAKVTELKKIQSTLMKNISELYKTAKAEIDRKDRMIGELRSQIDQLTLQKKFGFSNKRPRDDFNSHESDLPVKKARKDYERKRSQSPHKKSRSRSRSREKCRERGGHERSKHKSKKEHHRDRERRGSSNKDSGSRIKSSSHDKVDRNNEDKQKRRNEEAHADSAIKTHVAAEENKQCRVGIVEKSQKDFVDKIEKVQSYKCLSESGKISQKPETNPVDVSKKLKNAEKVPDQKGSQENEKIKDRVKADSEDEIHVRKEDKKIKNDIRKSLMDMEKMKIETQRKNDKIHDVHESKVKEHPKENQSYSNARRASTKSTGDDRDFQEQKIEKGDTGIEEKTNVVTEKQEKNVAKEENQSKVSARKTSTSSKRSQQERRKSVNVNENERKAEENLSRKEGKVSIRRESVGNKKVEQERGGKVNENGKSAQEENHIEKSQRDANVRITDTMVEEGNISRKESKVSVKKTSVSDKKVGQEPGRNMNENRKSAQNENHIEERQRDGNVRETNTMDEETVRKKVAGQGERNGENIRNSNLKDVATEKNNSNVENQNSTPNIITSQKTDDAVEQKLPQDYEKIQDTSISEKRNTEPQKKEEVGEIPVNDAVPEEKKLTNQNVKINIISDIRCTERAEDENPTSEMQVKGSSVSDEQSEQVFLEKANENGNTKDADRKLPDEQKSPQNSPPKTPKNAEEICKQTTPAESKPLTKSAEKNKTNKPKIDEVAKKLKARLGEEGNDNVGATFPLFETQTSESHIDKKFLDLVRAAAFGPGDDRKIDSDATDQDPKKSSDDLKQEQADRTSEKKPAKKDRRSSTDSRSKKLKDTTRAEDDSPVESHRVLRSATRRNGSGEKLERSSDSVCNKENQERTSPAQRKDEAVSASSVNLTHEGDIPVLHISDSDRSPSHAYLFDMNLTTEATSTPLNEKVNMQLLREDLNISQDLNSTAEVSKMSQDSIMWNGSAKSDMSVGKSNTSSARKRRRVVVTLID